MDNACALFLGKSVLKYKHQKLTFVPQSHIKCGNAEVSGWADNTEIRVATKRDLETWLGIFVHETCHVDQHTSKPEWFEASEVAVQRLDDWLGGSKVDNIDHMVRRVIELEWDCERRALAKIRRNKLPICPKNTRNPPTPTLSAIIRPAKSANGAKKVTPIKKL